MHHITSQELRQKRVYAQDGRDLGEVDAFDFDATTWAVRTLDIKLRREVLDDLGLKRPLMGTQTVQIRVDQIAGLSDVIVLKTKLRDVDHQGGKVAKE